MAELPRQSSVKMLGLPERYFIEFRTQHAYEVKPEPYVDTVEYLRADIADERVREARREDDEDFIKLVRQLAAMNTSVYGLVEAIIEDVGYGAHRVDREYARSAAEAKGE